LIHPHEQKCWIINCGCAIGSVLLQDRDEGQFNILSTASRVLNQTKQRYTKCKKELLAIIYVFKRFRIYIDGCKVTLFRDNKALEHWDSELHETVFLSSRYQVIKNFENEDN
jgi:hypothetical protein